METNDLNDGIAKINNRFFFLCQKHPALAPKELGFYLGIREIKDSINSLENIKNEYDDLIIEIVSKLDRAENKTHFDKLSNENRKFLNDSINPKNKLKLLSLSKLGEVIDNLDKIIGFKPPLITKGKVKELFIGITNELQDIYFNINNFKIWQKVDNHFSKYKGYEIYKVAEQNFNITRLHMHASMTASYQCIINTFCNLYEKVSNIGLIFQLRAMLCDDLKISLDDKNQWFEKPYNADDIIVSRNNFTAHLNLSYDIPKNIDKLIINIQVLERYFLNAYRKGQLLNNGLANINLINFLPITIYLDEYLKNFIDDRSKRIIESISRKS